MSVNRNTPSGPAAPGSGASTPASSRVRSDRILEPDRITRREAVRRTSAWIGGAVALSSVSGALAACGGAARESSSTWMPRTLSDPQAETVALISEHLIPETDTPGAMAARVHEYIDAMLTDFFSDSQRADFLDGLDRIDRRSHHLFGSGFLQATPAQRAELVEALNRAAYEPSPAREPESDTGATADLQQGEIATSSSTGAGSIGAAAAGTLVDERWDARDLGPRSFFRSLKQLVLVGFYTSEAGATQELRLNPMGSWRADVPYSEIGHAWA